jgi:uncharacterized protein
MTETTRMDGVSTFAVIPTEHASRYLQQLAKHFQHKLPVSFDPHQGEVRFSIGVCRMAADEGNLTLTLAAADAAQMEPLQDVVVRHLVRFAFREELAVSWQPV